MRVKQGMNLSAIIGIIYLSGGCFSNSIPRESSNSTLGRNDQMDQTSEVGIKSMETAKISREYENGTFNDSSISFVVGNRSEISKSKESVTDNVHTGGNGTIQIFFNFPDGNDTMKSENFSFDHFDSVNLNLKETAGFSAIGFLAFSALGYVGFVLWRRHLQNKYGNGQVLITEDVYDISDLRNFEI